MQRQHLHHNWTVRATSDLAEVPAAIRDTAVTAHVPGCVHTDLLRAGLIEDPYAGLNETKLRWIGRTDWEYRTRFDVDGQVRDHERVDLVFEGIDTIARIQLNGTHLANTANMHRAYRFDVRRLIRSTANELVVRFTSPVVHAENMRAQLGHMPANVYGGWFNYIRKMACNFGWDWGPIVPTSGIWRGVRLEAWDYARIHAVRPCFNGHRRVKLQVDVESAAARDTSGQWQIHAGLREEVDGRCCARGSAYVNDLTSAAVSVDFDHEPHRWWPHTHGTPFLYECSVELSHTEVAPERSTSRSFRLGLRTVELDSSLDDIGRKFVIKINGKPVFCKGFNWIPDDCFLDRACESSRVRRRIHQALHANANMLRVWGGGIYETDDFYDICDELGMLVWQDFLFACAAYPEVDPIKSEVEAEARYNVARLARHPSLALWNGCNENVWGYQVWRAPDADGNLIPWREQVRGRGWGAGYYFDLLPQVVKELDPQRPYWAASPWSGDRDVDGGLHANLSTHGNAHLWEVWAGREDYDHYRQYSPRFCSEFGFQGPPNYATLAQWLGEPELVRGSAAIELHQKAKDGSGRNDRFLAKHFETTDLCFDDWHYLLQLNQARALRAGVEWFRSRQPVCMGVLYWQLNDCYPVTSWSAIDSDGRPKLLWYATRHFYGPRLLILQPEADALVCYANNDTDQHWHEVATIRRLDFDGREIASIAMPIHVSPRANHRIAVLPTSIALPRDRSREFVVAEAAELRAIHFFAPDKELAYPVPQPNASLHGEGDLWHLRLTTRSLLRDLAINIDRLDPEASISDNAVTILPGESFTFVLRTRHEMSLASLLRPPVLQCANRFGKR